MLARITMLMLVLLAALMLAACGGGDAAGEGGSEDTAAETSDDSGTDAGDDGSDDTGDGGETLVLGVEGNKLEFDKTKLSAPAGTVTIKLENTSSIQHNVAIEDEDGEELAAGELVGEGETSEVTVDLEPGTYTYFCSPHKSAGMTGTLTVT